MRGFGIPPRRRSRCYSSATTMPPPRRIALLAAHPPIDPASPTYALPNYGVHRIEAALRAAPELADSEVHVLESRDRDPDALYQALEAVDADLVGLSMYLWSLPTVAEVAKRWKREHPERRVVAGGPSARPAMFRVAPFDDAHTYLDALVIDTPELAFTEIAKLSPSDVDGLSAVPGIELPVRRRSLVGAQWQPTAKRVDSPRLQDRIVSPYQTGLIEKGGMGCLQTYYGCPFSCTFCSWGAMGDADDVLDVEYIERELLAMNDAEVEGVLLVDAALNLNARAFKQLEAAEARVGLLQRALLHSEVYPAKLTDRHLRFIEGIRRPSLAVGVQSFDTEVLARLDRAFDAARFERVVKELAGISDVVVELIAGLPGDRPESFRETFERALALGTSVRVYPCLVLPDGFMTRAPAHFDIDWDSVSLKVRSCWGWTRDELTEMGEYLGRRVAEHGGSVGEYWWSFDSFTVGAGRGRTLAGGAVSSALLRKLGEWVPRATDARWRLERAYTHDGKLFIEAQAGATELTLWAEPMGAGEPPFATSNGIAFRTLGEVPPAEQYAMSRLVPVLGKILQHPAKWRGAAPE